MIINFIIQPFLVIFWALSFYPIILLIFLGMNLPGNKVNLPFTYNGKSQYQSKKIALTSIFIVIVVLFYAS